MDKESKDPFDPYEHEDFSKFVRMYEEIFKGWENEALKGNSKTRSCTTFVSNDTKKKKK